MSEQSMENATNGEFQTLADALAFVQTKETTMSQYATFKTEIKRVPHYLGGFVYKVLSYHKESLTAVDWSANDHPENCTCDDCKPTND